MKWFKRREIHSQADLLESFFDGCVMIWFTMVAITIFSLGFAIYSAVH